MVAVWESDELEAIQQHFGPRVVTAKNNSLYEGLSTSIDSAAIQSATTTTTTDKQGVTQKINTSSISDVMANAAAKLAALNIESTKAEQIDTNDDWMDEPDEDTSPSIKKKDSSSKKKKNKLKSNK
jgi:hypothetical protein